MMMMTLQHWPLVLRPASIVKIIMLPTKAPFPTTLLPCPRIIHILRINLQDPSLISICPPHQLGMKIAPTLHHTTMTIVHILPALPPRSPHIMVITTTDRIIQVRPRQSQGITPPTHHLHILGLPTMIPQNCLPTPIPHHSPSGNNIPVTTTITLIILRQRRSRMVAHTTVLDMVQEHTQAGCEVATLFTIFYCVFAIPFLHAVRHFPSAWCILLTFFFSNANFAVRYKAIGYALSIYLRGVRGAASVKFLPDYDNYKNN